MHVAVDGFFLGVAATPVEGFAVISGQWEAGEKANTYDGVFDIDGAMGADTGTLTAKVTDKKLSMKMVSAVNRTLAGKPIGDAVMPATPIAAMIKEGKVKTYFAMEPVAGMPEMAFRMVGEAGDGRTMTVTGCGDAKGKLLGSWALTGATPLQGTFSGKFSAKNGKWSLTLTPDDGSKKLKLSAAP
jgi:hypothetical protein